MSLRTKSLGNISIFRDLPHFSYRSYATNAISNECFLTFISDQFKPQNPAGVLHMYRNQSKGFGMLFSAGWWQTPWALTFPFTVPSLCEVFCWGVNIAGHQKLPFSGDIWAHLISYPVLQGIQKGCVPDEFCLCVRYIDCHLDVPAAFFLIFLLYFFMVCLIYSLLWITAAPAHRECFPFSFSFSFPSSLLRSLPHSLPSFQLIQHLTH